MDDYVVEEYIKPTVKRNTYDKSDDHYISEQDVSDSGSEKSEKSDNEEEVDDTKYSKSDKQAVPEVPKEKKEVNNKVKSNPQVPGSTARLILHVSNLSEETTKSMLEAFFGDAGQLKSVRIPKKRGTNNFAFVEMKDPESFKTGLSYNGRELDGQHIQVQQGSKNKKHTSRNKRKAQNVKGNSFKKFKQK